MLNDRPMQADRQDAGAAATRRVMVARMDNLGDVVLTGPAVRAVAASGAEVQYLCSRRGAPAARRLPGVSGVTAAAAPWIDADPEPVTRPAMEALMETVAASGADEALIFTSFHQSPLPLALVMRMAGIARVAAISVDYPGSLLDLRHTVPDDIHEVERGLSLAVAAGYALPAGDDGSLRLRRPLRDARPPMASTAAGVGPDRPYVVVHPGASVPARTWTESGFAELVDHLLAAGYGVVLTGSAAERPLAARIGAGTEALDLTGSTDFDMLVEVIAGADVVVCGNTGPAHLAAAVGTPVACLYAPTVPAVRWHPWRVPHLILGLQEIACAGCRARSCPVPGHPCLSSVTAEAVMEAVDRLSRRPVRPGSHMEAVAR